MSINESFAEKIETNISGKCPRRGRESFRTPGCSETLPRCFNSIERIPQADVVIGGAVASPSHSNEKRVSLRRVLGDKRSAMFQGLSRDSLDEDDGDHTGMSKGTMPGAATRMSGAGDTGGLAGWLASWRAFLITSSESRGFIK